MSLEQGLGLTDVPRGCPAGRAAATRPYTLQVDRRSTQPEVDRRSGSIGGRSAWSADRRSIADRPKSQVDRRFPPEALTGGLIFAI